MQKIPNSVSAVVMVVLMFATHAWAGDGNFDAQRGLTLNVYFDYREDPAMVSGKWTDYYRNAAGAWYDALETLSYVKRINIFNHIPEGKRRADIWTKRAASWEAYATLNGFQGSGLVTFTDQMDPSIGHHVRTFPHELGHYIFGLRDCYGGQIRDSAGNILPLPYYSASTMIDPSLNFRTYMWSDDFIRSAFFGAMIETLPAPFSRVFYNVGGRTTPESSTMDFNGPDFASVASHIGSYTLRIKMPAYNHGLLGIRSRAADSTFRSYTIANNQQEDNRESEWAGIARYFSITAPTTFTANSLPANKAPEIVIFDGSSVVICLDKSGSMEDENRIGLAKLGAQATMDLFRARAADNTPGQIVGVTSFDDATYVDAAPREIVGDGDRGALKGAIGGIFTGGSTSIGGGLRTSLNQLLSVPNPGQKIKTIILLSDGQHNAGESPSNVLPDLIRTNVVAYTVAVGSDADRSLLAAIAAQTGGQAFVAASPVDILRYFYTIYSDASGSGSLHERSIDLAPAESQAAVIPVEAGTDRAAFSAIADNAAVQFSLQKPDGATITPSSMAPGVSYRTAGQQRLFEVSNPQAGNWQIIVSRPQTTGGGPFTKDENPDLAINDNTTVESALTVNANATIASLKVTVDIRHTYRGDLTVTLRSPTGTSVILHDGTGGGTDDIVGTFGLDLVSAQSLGAFDGQNLAGEWKLIVTDDAGGDQGFLRSWALSYGDSGITPVRLTAFNDNAGVIVNGSVGQQNVAFPNPILVRASLQAGGPVAGAQVFGRVSFPNGGSTRVDLFDDGSAAHGDETANDGVYAALFDNYSGNGVYEFSITASNVTGHLGGLRESGSDPVPAPPFVRSFTVQATVAGVPPLDLQWVTVNKLTSTRVPTQQNRDRLSLSGSFNLIPPDGFDPSAHDLMLRVGGFMRNFPAANWRQEGRTQRFAQRSPAGTAILDYLVGGSSRCRYTITVAQTNIEPAFNGFLSSVPVQLQLGNVLNETVEIDVDAAGNSFRLGSEPADPIFFVDTLSITRNVTRTNSDALVLTGRVLGDYLFNPAAHGIAFALGPYDVAIPAGTLTRPASGSRITARLPQADGSLVALTFDFDKGLLSLRVTKANLSGIVNPLNLSLQLSGIAGASWNYRLNAQVLPNNKGFRY